MKRKIIFILLSLFVLLVVFRMVFFRPIDYFGNIDTFSITEIVSSEGVEIPTLCSERVLDLLENHYVRRNLNLTRTLTSITPANDYIIIDFRSEWGMKTMVIDLELSIVKFTGNIERFIDFYYLVDPDRFIEELLNLE